MIRLHVPQPLSAAAVVAPTLDQSRYLTQVMRLKLGDTLLVFNGRDGEWRCVIAEILKKGVILRAEEQVRPQAFGPDLELIVALVKKSRVETIVEKAAELGAARVRLAVTQRTNVEHVRLDRLDAIAIEAAEQTGRLDVPTVDDPQKLATILDAWDPSRRLMFCDETGGQPVMRALESPSPGGEGERAPWAILIGPEGGFSPEERERLRSLPFMTAVSLGPRILRADTAAIAAMALWQAAVGDWER
ncbi:16S rRNA (uracil(1498)-N(3))-methyltransferase [Brevundimonas subvibrioides]|uniref:16S rRNA (uracil(1498)-N(3))-methyltransferase n=1 Tax=Brevundimonas subvibrioides TaxID=74313 RepID=UPI0022B3CC85|nr:16S rRNA (uracil(1498)-N(3))-methyltransferase [Brevundimonas subvibrioides]